MVRHRGRWNGSTGAPGRLRSQRKQGLARIRAFNLSAFEALWEYHLKGRTMMHGALQYFFCCVGHAGRVPDIGGT